MDMDAAELRSEQLQYLCVYGWPISLQLQTIRNLQYAHSTQTIIPRTQLLGPVIPRTQLLGPVIPRTQLLVLRLLG